jgi:DNA-binding NarL/FixJ family response regulator
MDLGLRILIADDHPIFRKGLRQILETDKDVLSVTEVADGERALEEIAARVPDIALLDIDMPRLNGLQVVQQLRRKGISLDLVFLTMYKEEDMVNEAMELGVMGYVLKESAVSDILACIHTVAEGKHFISPLISSYLVSRTQRTQVLEGRKPGLLSLTAAERRILALIADGKSSKEIASALFISHRTVENHRSNICSKLNLKGSYALLKFALENKEAL